MAKKNIFRKLYYRSYKIWTPFRVIRNLVLTWRYPWLGIYGWRKEKIDRTSVWASPRDGGWNKAFFFPMNERIRKAAKETGVFKTLRTDEMKSKYGGLRFYASGGNKRVYEIIHEYEYMSQWICECCGEPDVGSTSGWIMPICKTCFKRGRYNDARPYEEVISDDNRIPDYYQFSRFEPGDEHSTKYKIDIKNKANEIRRRWNCWHPTRRKEYAKY